MNSLLKNWSMCRNGETLITESFCVVIITMCMFIIVMYPLLIAKLLHCFKLQHLRRSYPLKGKDDEKSITYRCGMGSKIDME